MLAPDPVTRCAVEAAALAASRPLANMYGGCFKPDGRDQRGDCADGDCYCIRVAKHCAIAAIAAFLAAMGQDLAAARVRRCGDQPEPNDDAAFLTSLLDRVRARDRVSLADVARLRRLADWADAAPAPGWDGTLDPGETERAVDDARRRMG